LKNRRDVSCKARLEETSADEFRRITDRRIKERSSTFSPHAEIARGSVPMRGTDPSAQNCRRLRNSYPFTPRRPRTSGLFARFDARLGRFYRMPSDALMNVPTLDQDFHLTPSAVHSQNADVTGRFSISRHYRGILLSARTGSVTSTKSLTFGRANS
jgi:hypothetical protein